MREDASITVNMIEYAAIPTKTTLFPSEKMRWGQGCLKKQSAEYAIILHKVTVQITEQLSRQRLIQNTFQTFKMERFAKRIITECWCATRNYSGQGGFVELKHFDKDFVKNTTEKEALQEKILESFLLDTLKTTF